MQQNNKLQVKLTGQLTKMWCWAASAEMVMHYAGQQVSQCKQANHMFGRTDSCHDPTPYDCVKGGWPQFQAWGFNSDQTAVNAALSFDAIRAQIDADHPFPFAWRWTGGGGHMMTAVGYADIGGNQLVYVNDPWPVSTGDPAVITYANFVGGDTWQGANASHTHWKDYYNIVRSSATPGGGGSSPVPTEAPEPIVTEDGSADQAAERGITLLKDLPTADPGAEPYAVAPEFGFGQLDTPLAVHYIFQEQLLGWQVGTTADELLVDGQEMIYPLRVDGEVRSSVVVAGSEGRWRIKRIGSPNLTGALTEARTHEVGISGLRSSDYFVVHVPHLYQVFLAHRKGGELVLSPVLGVEPAEQVVGDRDVTSKVVDNLVRQARDFVGALPEK
jgi:Papain-like cysteine protease AvrRpt2